MKQRNPSWGCPQVAQQITLAFDFPIDKDVAFGAFFPATTDLNLTLAVRPG